MVRPLTQTKTNNKLVKQIEDRRLELGLTVKELAQRAGVHKNTVSLWGKGISSPGVDSVEAICEELGLRLVIERKVDGN